MGVKAEKGVRDQSYSNVENLLNKIVWDFHRQYKGSLSLLMSDARFHFFEAYETYNEEKASFSTWVRFIVWRRLLDTKRKEVIRASKVEMSTDIELDTLLEKDKFDVNKLVAELGHDASHVVGKLINPSNSVRSLMNGAGQESCFKIRCRMRQELKKEGWDSDRINQAFEEVRNAL